MEALKKIIGNNTYAVMDSSSNRFNFLGPTETNEPLFAIIRDVAQCYTEWDLTDSLPKDVQRAIAVMAENGVDMEGFTGVVTFTDHEYVNTYYLLTW